MQYHVIYSKRRTLAIQLDRDGPVLVRSPYGVSRSRIERFLADKESWIIQQQKKLSERLVYPDDPFVLEELRRKAKEELIPKTWEMAKRLDFSIKSVRITSARTRFGSCSADDRINLSLYLMLYPEEAREYVILHELCHTVEHNHSKRFYALLDNHMPDHRERRKLLRR